MSGINFRANGYQLRTNFQRAEVKPQKNEEQETKPAAEKEAKKPEVKLNIQTSGLNALGRYNMVSLNTTTAKRATLTANTLKPAGNGDDVKINANELTGFRHYLDGTQEAIDEFKLRGEIGDYHIVTINGVSTCMYISAIGENGERIVDGKSFGSEEEADKFGRDEEWRK